MASFFLLCRVNSFIISILALLIIGQCLKIDDIIQDNNDGIESTLAINLDALEQKINAETAEVRNWSMRVVEIERQMPDIRADKLEVLSRRERALKDPRLALFAGNPGSPGRPGKTGRPGRIGKRGQKGQKGVAGPPGIRGPIGSYGRRGWKGPPGFPGVEGPKGVKGEQGFKGHAGYIGDVGFVGYIGHEGKMGPPGLMGHVGFIGMIGWPGPHGDKGEVGIIGLPGYPGRQGVPGRVGVYGEPGLMGEIGITGPPGHVGFEGDKGESGMHGETGPWGAVGRPGPVYDPYVGMMAPMVGKFLGLQREENCTYLENGVSRCLPVHGGKNIPVNIQYNSKSLPVFSQPPPGAHVMPAEKVQGKSLFGPHFAKSPIAYASQARKSPIAQGLNAVKSPLQYGPNAGKMALGPPAYGKQYAPAHVHPIEFFYDEDKDILTEQEYNDLINTTRLEATNKSIEEVSSTENHDLFDYLKSNISTNGEDSVYQTNVETHLNTTKSIENNDYNENELQGTIDRPEYHTENVTQSSYTLLTEDKSEFESEKKKPVSDT